MTYKEALKRAVATFVAGATAAPLTSAVVDISFLKAAAVAGVVAVWNLVARTAQAWKATDGSSL
jgi:hypothetical protein